MANVSITQLPTAQTLDGSESVPIVQKGVTVQTTVGNIANSPVLTQTFLTVGAQPALGNSRYFTNGPGMTTVDGGAGGAFSLNLIDAPLSLVNSGTGFQVKTSSNVLTNRSLEVGNGLSIANADGIAGNPLIAYLGLMSNIASQTGTGLLAITAAGTATPVVLTGTTGQIDVVNGNGALGAPTLSLAPSGVSAGSYTNTNLTVDATGRITYAETGSGGGGSSVLSFSGDATGLTPDYAATGDIVLGGVLNAAHGGSGATTLTGYLKGNGTSAFTADASVPTTDLSGTVTNAQLANSAITINGTSVSLGASVTIPVVLANPLTIGTGLSGTSYDGSAPVTVAIDSTVATLTGTQVLTNKTLTAPVIKNNFKFEAAGIGAYSQFAGTIGSWISNTNNFQVVYTENQNNGSDASADWVAYNDASDGASYFIDMGINSSGYTSTLYPIFTPNSAYLFTGGGLSGQQTDLFIGTSNAASDIIFFTGDVLTANIRGSIQGDTGNWLVGGTTDTGELLQVAGTVKITGATTFGSTVLLNANPTLALQAATKQYVDAAVSSGFTVHPPVSLATIAALPANTYANGALGVGATLTAVATGVLTIDGSTATAGLRVLIKNEVAAANNGAYTVTVAGAIGVAYILTRATDFDQAAAGEIANNAYFFVNAGGTLASSSFVLSQTAAITVGTTALPFTLFAAATVYTGGTNIDVTGSVISLTGAVAATNGGTGTATVAVGDLLYGSATNTWSKLALGSAYKSMTVNASGTQLEWNSIALNQATAVSGQLGVSNGGTGAATLTGYVKGAGTAALTASATIPSTDISGLGTMATQAANAVVITGGTINGTTIGATSATTGKFTTVTATSGISGGTF